MKLRPGFTLGGCFDRTLSANVRRESQPKKGDDLWMEQALLSAMNAVGWSAPNPSVGAVMVDPQTQQEISRGFTQAYRHEHAERMAIEAAPPDGERVLTGATLYVTLEPCSHVGFQPPCADLIISSGIKRVVIGAGDPDPRVSGRGIAALKAAGIEVVSGVLKDECMAWHLPFLLTRDPKRKKIFWAAKWAQTLDGDLADLSGNSKWISCQKSRAYTHWLRQKYDAILVSAETYLRDSPSLTVRDCALPHRRDPIKIILDRSGRLKSKAPDLKLDPSIRVVRSILEVESLEIDPPLQSVLVEGGPTLLNALIKEQLFDVVHQFISPKRFEPAPVRQRQPYRVTWSPSSEWHCAVQQKIDDDELREWVKA